FISSASPEISFEPARIIHVDTVTVDVQDGSRLETADMNHDTSEATPYKVYGNANQTFHRILSTEPIESLILLSPRFDRNKFFDIVVIVISAPWEWQDREEIRRQWASKEESRLQQEQRSLVIFVVGRSQDINEEADFYGDLLQVDIDEDYRNLVYKIETGFQWVRENVQSQFVAKADSDTVVHIDRLHSLLTRYESVLELAGMSDDWLACHKNTERPVIRDEYSEWLDFPCI
ncbi:hypothetical protein PMAYCL1PPCAC_08069, partial [Pristionchus mayeri]